MKIDCKGISFDYDGLKALSDLNLHIHSGELIALLGPSGCGKTTLLRIIAGLLPMQEGRLYYDNDDISTWTPQKRNTAMVFQSYALFPHLSVMENVAYGLKSRSIGKKEAAKRSETYLEKVHLSGMEHRKVQELSGGQQQRVALARALVLKPDVLLFDEPLSNLDAKLRIKMRREIRMLQRESGITSIYVTHDQEEAMAIADRIVVMDQGFIQQIGTPEEVYHNPANEFVANFMGASNLIHINGEKRMYRPENVVLREKAAYKGLVKWTEHLGSIQEVCLETDFGELVAHRFSSDSMHYRLNAGDTAFFDLSGSGKWK